MKLKFKKLHPAAITPEYATTGAACFDLHCLPAALATPIFPGEANIFRTGLSFEVPAGHVMLIFSRSGHGFKNDIRLSNAVGVIDSDYRGEVLVKLRNDQPGFNPSFLVNPSEEATFTVIHPGDRIAQAMIVPIPTVELEEVDELSDTARGTGGFGSKRCMILQPVVMF